MTNTEALQVLAIMQIRPDRTIAEMEAIGIASEALEEKIAEERHNGEEALYKGFEAGMNGTFPEGEWIPVEMGLPEPGQIILAYCQCEKLCYMGVDCRTDTESFDDPNVTHWRYLPEPPGKEEEHET